MATRRFRFGAFEFDGQTGELRRDGAAVRLQAQPAAVLGALLERAGEVVTREELREVVWGKETNVDFEGGLNYCVAQLRSALGDSAEAAVYVKTVPKRGYQFVAPVVGVEEAAAVVGAATPVVRVVEDGAVAVADLAASRAAGVSAGADLAAGRIAGVEAGASAAAASAVAAGEKGAGAAGARVRSRRGLVAAGVAAIGVGGAAWFGWSRMRGAAGVRIAVARFENQTGDAGMNGFTEGLSDALVAELATTPLGTYQVIGNAVSLRQPRARQDLARIAEELRANYIVLGQVQGTAAAGRVLVHLIRLPDQAHLWVTRVEDPDYGDAVRTQKEIARRTVGDLAAKMGRGGG